MSKIIGFGEILMRLSPPDLKKIEQTNHLDITFGGTEFNVLGSLSNFGLETSYATVLANDSVGKAALSFIRKNGVATNFITTNEHPQALFFLEVGAVMRSSVISYNRTHSAFAKQDKDLFDWENIINKGDAFQWTGITPAISKNSKESLKAALLEGQKKGIERYTDPTFRKGMWQYGEDGPTVLRELVGLSTIFLGGIDEMNLLLETNYTRTKEDFLAASKQLLSTFKELKLVVEKQRSGDTSSSQGISSRAYDGKDYFETKKIVISPVIDRIGTGDAWAAAFIFAQTKHNLQKSLAFADAACALKHTIPGDLNLVSEEDVVDVMNGNLQGRIKR